MAKIKIRGANPNSPAEPPPNCNANKCCMFIKIIVPHPARDRERAHLRALAFQFTAGALAYLGGDSFYFGHEQGMKVYGLGRDQTSDKKRAPLPSAIE